MRADEGTRGKGEREVFRDEYLLFGGNCDGLLWRRSVVSVVKIENVVKLSFFLFSFFSGLLLSSPL